MTANAAGFSFLVVKKGKTKQSKMSDQTLYLLRCSLLITLVTLTPFTAPACKISGLKEARMHLQTVFSGPIAYLLSVLHGLMKILSHSGATKKTKRFKGFKFGTFIGACQMTSWQ